LGDFGYAPEQKALQAKPMCVSAPFILALLFVFIVATRRPLAPRYLYYFDSANFALSLEHFNLHFTSRSLPDTRCSCF
jgi:hypothetical protein